MMTLLHRARAGSQRAVLFVALAAACAADAQAPSNGVRIIELTPHLAVNDAATFIEAEKYADAIVILDTFLATEPAQPPEAFYLLGLAHYKLGDFAKALPPAQRAATEAAMRPRTGSSSSLRCSSNATTTAPRFRGSSGSSSSRPIRRPTGSSYPWPTSGPRTTTARSRRCGSRTRPRC